MIFDACQLKETILTDKQTSANAMRNRPGIIDNSRRMNEVARELISMGINQDYVDIAIRHMPNSDRDTLFDWIQNNTEKIII